MRFPTASAGFASCAVALIMGCGLDSAGTGAGTGLLPGDAATVGGDDATLGFTVDSGVVPSDDAGSGGGGGDDATIPLDASTGVDSALPPPPPPGVDSCSGTTEICNNGIDDNCDGKIDCADPQCSGGGWQCTAAVVPQGWTVVEYANAPTASACGNGYTPASSVYEGPFAGASCTCACSVATPGSCTSGNLSVVQSEAATCVGVPAPEPTGNGACQTLPLPQGYMPSATAHQQVTPAAYTAGTCQPSGAITRPSIGQEGHVCTETSSPGAGCANSAACVPSPQAGFGLCIQHNGNPACPAGFTTVHNVGSGVNDSRGCSQCTCTGPTAQCANGVITLFAEAQCGADGGTATIQANGQCNPVVEGANAGAAPAFHAYEYSAQTTGEQCGAGSSTPDGAVTLTGPSTICCQ